MHALFLSAPHSWCIVDDSETDSSPLSDSHYEIANSQRKTSSARASQRSGASHEQTGIGSGPEVLLWEVSSHRYWETPQGLRMLLGAFRGGNPLERIVAMSSKCRDEISPHKSASVYECVRCCRYTVSLKCLLARTAPSRELKSPTLPDGR